MDAASSPAPIKSATSAKTSRLGKPRACAECRRLKLRCDRTFPCQSCIRRGCSALCPDKCFTDEATPSSLKASSLRSREQIQMLQEKVAVLEAALAAQKELNAAPLPSENTNISLSPPPSSEIPAGGNERIPGIDKTIELFGALSVGEDGSTIFHGATSMAEHFVPNSLDSKDIRSLLPAEQPVLPSNLQLLSVLFPFSPQSVATNFDINEMLVYLPPAAEVLDILIIYWSYLSLGTAPINAHQFTKSIYNYFYPGGILKTHLRRTDSHRLGLLFVTLALGLLTDLRLPLLSTEAEKYYQLARASLSLDPIHDHPTLHGLQCMLSISWYMSSAPVRTTAGYLWNFNGILIKIASSLGIFHDSRRWLTDADEIEQRETLCWELVSREVWQSFAAGRPCSLDLALIDCRRPSRDSTTATDALPGPIPEFDDWKYRFYPLVNNVLLVVQRPGPVRYTEILDLERQIQECVMLGDSETSIETLPDVCRPGLTSLKDVQRFTALLMREAACCLLHRRFLSLAMQKNSEDPRKDPFYYSAFQAGIRACWIVRAHIAMYRSNPQLISRIPSFWSLSFSAAVILGAISARYWNREYAQGSYGPFQEICALFQETAGTSVQPPNALQILQRLYQHVRAQFPTSADVPKEFNALPFLGAQPSFANAKATKVENMIPSGLPAMRDGGLFMSDPTLHVYEGTPPLVSPSPESSHSSSEAPPLDTFWSLPDLNAMQVGNDNGGIPIPWTGGQEWQTFLPEGISNTPLETFTATDAPSISVADVGHWDQFLDRLGVWEMKGSESSKV